mmetsp:Transcript_32358/g.97498  ORF Transcript_32358/g.97498 Transcript_32358/m.97498 type:complete len:98 (-) Transcript_32358:43-336(-)
MASADDKAWAKRKAEQEARRRKTLVEKKKKEDAEAFSLCARKGETEALVGYLDQASLPLSSACVRCAGGHTPTEASSWRSKRYIVGFVLRFHTCLVV